jgi:heptaprenyl diphosphate synthase
MSVCEGELQALADVHQYHRERQRYWDHIWRKTGSLMSATCRIGALLGGVDDVGAAGAYGRLLGQAFQIVDDVLDYTGEASEVGKPVGHDLREGSVTLPLIEAFATERDRLDALLKDSRGLDDQTVAEVVQIVRESGGAERALEVARDAAATAALALDGLPECEARRTLAQLTSYVVERKL